MPLAGRFLNAVLAHRVHSGSDGGGYYIGGMGLRDGGEPHAAFFTSALPACRGHSLAHLGDPLGD
jgi:hypothetical protein